MHVDNQCIEVYVANTSSFIVRIWGILVILKLIIWLIDINNYKIKKPH